ncbi:MAG: hypothetical protein COA83_04825 [Methylophaga sp.]|nr:MAG: hypothetical protein COA83_04825 [Methylophaga sp.]
MNNLTKILSSAVLAMTVAFSAINASAATYTTGTGGGHGGDIYVQADGYKYLNTSSSYTSGTGPDETYIIIEPTPNAVNNAQHLQDALAAIGSTFIVTDFTSSGGNTYPGLNSTSFVAQGFLFNGFMVKASTNTLVGIFDIPISTIFWNTLWQTKNGVAQDMSHIAFFNTTIPQIPIPATLWLFAPALLGLMGFRRRNNKA